MNFTLIASTALPLFLIMDPLGNTSLCLSILKDYSPKQQQRIILREMLIALGFIVLFLFVGDTMLGFLEIDPHTIKIAGGLILLLISMKMIFPQIENSRADNNIQDPFIVPIAIPLVAGPSLIATIALYAKQIDDKSIMLSAIFLAWSLVALILYFAPHLKKILRERGLTASERLMGLILILISSQMLLDGIKMFVKTL